jgi:predicted metalloendopeptidase
MQPIQAELAKIDAITDLQDLPAYIAHFLSITGKPLLVGVIPSADEVDTTKMSLYMVSGSLFFSQENFHGQQPGSPFDIAMRGSLKQMLMAADYEETNAARVADVVADLERTLHAGMLTPVESRDPAKSYQPRPFNDVAADLKAFDLKALLEPFGVAVPETLVQTEPRYLAVLDKALKDRSLQDVKDYLKVRLIGSFSPYLGSRFDESARMQTKIIYGVDKLPPREEQVQARLQADLGQPVSRLYVEKQFDEKTRKTATEMVERIHRTFLERLDKVTWLTAPTKQAAREKLEKLSYKLGYPEEWIDVSSVKIDAGDPVGNAMRLAEFDVARTFAKLGKPVVHEAFANPKSTLPIIINAGYDLSINGFEVPAAMLQPAAFDVSMDAATYFCRLGAVIGHEMTHGFDSAGRLHDADGNLRDWWTPADAAAFEKEASKLVEQANAYEVLPGLTLNGALAVTENMADVGGINFAFDALQTYLAEHPQENVAIDGFSPQQRCFISWAQFWSMKVTDEVIRSVFISNPHPPSFYRATAALKHVDAFYEAFDITEGDKEWVPPEKRVRAW